MKITRILAYRVELPLREGNYKWSGGKSVTVFDSTVVRVSTAEGAPQRVNGRMSASTAPGLGISPRVDVLGDPVLIVSR